MCRGLGCCRRIARWPSQPMPRARRRWPKRVGSPCPSSSPRSSWAAVFGRNSGKFKPLAGGLSPLPPYARRKRRQWMPAQKCGHLSSRPRSPRRADQPMPDALELLKTRRSIKPVELAGPAPSAAEIETLLTIASRVPDHGKLVPWRFIVFEGEARLAAGEAMVAAFCAKYPQAKPEHVEAERIRQPRRAACEDSGMGAGAVGGRRRHEPRARRARARLWRDLDNRVVRV